MNRLQELIRQRMNDRRWTQADIARRGDMSRALVGRYYHGHDLPTGENVGKLAVGLGVPEDVLRALVAELHGLRPEHPELLGVSDDDRAFLAIMARLPANLRTRVQQLVEEIVALFGK